MSIHPQTQAKPHKNRFRSVWRPDLVIWRRVLWAVAFLSSILPGSFALAAENAGPVLFVSLEGKARFRAGDDPALSNFGLDDSQWREIEVPGGWQRLKIDPPGPIGWLRFHFVADQFPESVQAALSLGYVGNASEAYLNGVNLGRIGSINPVISPPPGTLHVYPLPPRLLKPGETNVLSIRIMNQAGMGGILGGPIGIGPFAELHRLAVRREFLRHQIEWIVQLLLGALGAGSVFLLLRGRGGRTHVWTAIFAGSEGGMYLLLMLAGNRSLGLDLWLVRIAWVLSSFGPLAMTFLVSELFGAANSRTRRFLAVLYAPLAAAFFFLGTNLAWFSLMSLLYGLFFLANLGVSISVCLLAWKRAVPGARTITWGLVPMFAGGMLDAFSTTIPILPVASTPFYLWEIGLVCLVTVLGCVLIEQYLKDMDKLSVLSRNILRERDWERQRLARDLHDGVGQSLQALKMMLQMKRHSESADSAQSATGGDEVIGQLGNCIKDLRLLAHEMHPAASEESSTMDSMRAYARELERQFQVSFNFHTQDGDFNLSGETAFHCFLIFKEAVGNSIRHGGARRIQVGLKRFRDRLRFEVEDDGHGFDAAAATSLQHGLGLRSIRERAELLGGSFELESIAGQGTHLVVELPLETAGVPPTGLSGERPTPQAGKSSA